MRAYKVEIDPTPRQIELIHQNVGVCRFMYNAYIAYNQEIYEKENRFVSGIEFDKYVNAVMKQEKTWIATCNTKARKQSIMNAETAFKRFFKGQAKFPRFKKKGKQHVKIYLPKNNQTDFVIQRHKGKLPLLGWVKFKEKGYVPQDQQVSSCTISQRGNRYYISFLMKKETITRTETKTPHRKEGVGIDLGLKDFAITSDNVTFGNINKSRRIRRLEVTLKRAQRALARKLEQHKKRKKTNALHKEEYGANIRKNILRIQNLHRKLQHIRHAYLRKVITDVVKTKPSFITIEDLNIKGMMKNKHLARSVGNQQFYQFRIWLEQACKQHGIELRQVSRFYPSSKCCSACGKKKITLSLSERVFTCTCGFEMDRDLNVSINLREAKEYTVLVG